jgi:hypothetical protein
MRKTQLEKSECFQPFISAWCQKSPVEHQGPRNPDWGKGIPDPNPRGNQQSLFHKDMSPSSMWYDCTVASASDDAGEVRVPLPSWQSQLFCLGTHH